MIYILIKILGKRDNFMYVEQKYGGHLGFYEGGLCYPDPLTWLDRLVVQLSDALVIYSSDVKGVKEISNNPTGSSVLSEKDNTTFLLPF